MLSRIIFIIIYFVVPFSMVKSQDSDNGNVHYDEDYYYKIIDIPVPENVILEVGGMVTLPNGEIAICTRRGEVWLVSVPTKFNEKPIPIFKRFAYGMHEPLGLNYKDESFYITQRGELTKLNDNNGDGMADSYERIVTWPLTGNYHEYSYGPKFLADGNMMVTLNLGWNSEFRHGESKVPWRGWVLKITPDGNIIPFATGLRSPAGSFVNSKGDFFYSENEGDWVGSGRISHVEKGDFLGNPHGLVWSSMPNSPLKLNAEQVPNTGKSLFEVAKDVRELKPPAIWLPHGIMGTSTSDMIEDNTEGEFGPFGGQVFVGDQGQSKIMRIYLEQINGIYQGVIFPFREGFSSGVFRMTWGNDGTMFVGMTSRGWSSTGKKPYGLQQVVWTGNIPFEMKTIKIKKDGFEINFTKPIDPKSALDKNSYDITRFNYKYHADYGSPVIDNTSCPIRDVEIRTDSLSVRLYVDSLKLGDIHEIKAEGIKSSKGIKLLHDVGYYTLNSFPNKDIPLNKDDRGGKSNSQNNGSHLISDTDRTTFHAPEDYNDFTKKEFLQDNGLSYEKRVTKMPKEWKGQIDRSIRIGTKPGMKFDKEYVTIKAGSKIELTFVNTDDMLHNLLIVNPKSAIEVGESALKLGLKGHQKQYIPDNKNVLYHTNILQPNNSETIYFIAPNTPGEYMYVCTIPGHYLSMQGVMKVE